MLRTRIYVSYFNNVEFPTKIQWKKIVTEKVLKRTKLDIFEDQIQASDKWEIITHVLARYSYSPLWKMAQNNPLMLDICKRLLRGIGIFLSRSYTEICRLCELRTDNLIVHMICLCNYKEYQRNMLWQLLYSWTCRSWWI